MPQDILSHLGVVNAWLITSLAFVLASLSPEDTLLDLCLPLPFLLTKFQIPIPIPLCKFRLRFSIKRTNSQWRIIYSHYGPSKVHDSDFFFQIVENISSWKARWELLKDAAFCFEQILEAAPHKTAAVQSLISHLRHYRSKTNKYWEQLGK